MKTSFKRACMHLLKICKIVKILCEWNAVDAEAVRKVLAKIPELPVDGIYPMAIFDSEDFR